MDDEKKTKKATETVEDAPKRRGRPPKTEATKKASVKKETPKKVEAVKKTSVKNGTPKKIAKKVETTEVTAKRRGRPPKKIEETIQTEKVVSPMAPIKEEITEIKNEEYVDEPKVVDVPEEPIVKQEEPSIPFISKEREKEIKPSTFKTSEVIILIVITAIISFAMGYLVGRPIRNDKENEEVLNDPIMQEFLENYNYIIKNYYGKVNKDELLNGAISGMVDALGDEHSMFIDPSTSSNFDISLKGNYEGLGIQIGNLKLQDGTYSNILVLKVYEGSDAYNKGIKPGDEVLSVDGIDMTGKLSSEASAHIRDSKNNSFKLVIKRDGKEQTVTVEKKKVDIISVHSRTIEQNNKRIGYLGIDIFASNTDTQFKKALKDLEKQNINSLIIDVRGNSGGHLTAVTNMLSEFLDSTHIIYQIDEQGTVSTRTSSGSETKKYPIIVLMDENSASASEVMAACLKEEYGATLIGKTTVGKGTVQTLVTLSNNQEYKITTKKWLTPKGNWLNGKGLTPDYDVDLSDEYIKNPSDATDNQLQKAIELLTK